MAYIGTSLGATGPSIYSNPPMRLSWGTLAAGGFTTAPSTTLVSATFASTASPFYAACAPTKQGASLWIYHTTDTSSAMGTTGYFTDAWQLGMRTGDMVIGVANISTAGVGTPYLSWVNVSTAGGHFSNGSTASMNLSSV